MVIFTDDINFASKWISKDINWKTTSINSVQEKIIPLAERLFNKETIFISEIKTQNMWQFLFLVKSASDSQFDILIDLSRKNVDLPHGILCLAGSGKKFHGFKNRKWESLPGNIHLSILLSPKIEVKHFDTGFLILAAVSVINTIDTIPCLKNRSKIRWINDILIEKKKVCGVLAHTLTQGRILAGAVLGIGLNVITTPKVEPTPFVSKVASLCDFTGDSNKINLKTVFENLIHFLELNYDILINHQYHQLLEFYRQRSLILGQSVTIMSDDPPKKMEKIAEGKVSSIGDNLEIYFDSCSSPVSKGRLILNE